MNYIEKEDAMKKEDLIKLIEALPDGCTIGIKAFSDSYTTEIDPDVEIKPIENEKMMYYVYGDGCDYYLLW